jgi:hypothetical protein
VNHGWIERYSYISRVRDCDAADIRRAFERIDRQKQPQILHYVQDDIPFFDAASQNRFVWRGANSEA